MGTVVVGAIVLTVVLLIIKDMLNKKARGKSVTGCDGDCGHCGGHCH